MANFSPARRLRDPDLQHLADGGRVRGHSPRSDSDNIDAKLTAGEYVLPVDTVEAVGEENLDALRAATHDPRHGRTTLRDGAMHMAGGGRVDDERPDRVSSPSNIFPGNRLQGTSGFSGAPLRPGAPPAAAPTPGMDDAQRQALISQIPTGGNGGGPTPPAQQTTRLQDALDTDLGRNVYNTAMALPGLRGTVGGVVRTGGAISGVLDIAGKTAARAGAVAPAIGELGLAQPATTAQPGGAAAAPAQAQTTPPTAVRPGDTFAGPDARYANPGAVAQPTDPSAPTNAVTRSGNRYFGGNVAGDITINGRAPGGGTISAQNMAAADALAGREQLRALGGAALAQPVQFAQAPTVLHSGNDWASRNALRNLEVSASSITNNGGRFDENRGTSTARKAYAAALGEDIKRQGAQPAVDLETNKSNSSLRGVMAQADATRYSTDQRLRGDIFKAVGTGRTAALQAAREERQAAREERNYQVGRRDKALERLDKVFEAHATTDGKVDANQLAELRNGAQAFLGSAIEAARKRGDMATVAALEEQGPSALAEDPQLMRQYTAGLKADRAARSGWLPGERYVGTDNPGARTVTGVDKGLLYDTAQMSDGSTVNANRLRYRDGGLFSGINPWAERTAEFDSIDPNGYLRKAPR